MKNTQYQTQKSTGTSKVPQRAATSLSGQYSDKNAEKFFRGKPSKDKNGNYITY